MATTKYTIMTTLCSAVCYSFCLGTRFKLGKTIYTYISTTFDVTNEEVTEISTGKKRMAEVLKSLYIVKNEKNNKYIVLDNTTYGNKNIEVL